MSNCTITGSIRDAALMSTIYYRKLINTVIYKLSIVHFYT